MEIDQRRSILISYFIVFRLNVEHLSGELNNLRKNLNSLQSSIGKGDEDVKNQLSAFLQVKFLNEFQS